MGEDGGHQKDSGDSRTSIDTCMEQKPTVLPDIDISRPVATDTEVSALVSAGTKDYKNIEKVSQDSRSGPPAVSEEDNSIDTERLRADVLAAEKDNAEELEIERLREENQKLREQLINHEEKMDTVGGWWPS